MSQQLFRHIDVLEQTLDEHANDRNKMLQAIRLTFAELQKDRPDLATARSWLMDVYPGGSQSLRRAANGRGGKR